MNTHTPPNRFQPPPPVGDAEAELAAILARGVRRIFKNTRKSALSYLSEVYTSLDVSASPRPHETELRDILGA